ncbi:MAG TPA: hypothetical protein VFG41_07855 [Sphingomicrobium sp.]|nr:hypothetical protein [Sphingomicrobium sp.]
MLNFISDLLFGFGFVLIGALYGWSPPTPAEAGLDPASLPKARQPKVRRQLGWLFIVLGVLIGALRILSRLI